MVIINGVEFKIADEPYPGFNDHLEEVREAADRHTGELLKTIRPGDNIKNGAIDIEHERD